MSPVTCHVFSHKWSCLSQVNICVGVELDMHVSVKLTNIVNHINKSEITKKLKDLYVAP